MPRNGVGTYTLPSGNPFITGSVISSTTMNNTLSDIATALTASIANDGQTPITANIPMNNKKITGMANATLSTDAVAYGQLSTYVTAYAPSAVFTPTTSNNSNVLTAGAGYGTYIRVGNIVNVSVRQPSTPSGVGSCSFQIALPIASNITAVTQISGVGYSLNALAPDTVTVQGVVANPGRVIIAWAASGTSAGHTNIVFSYEVH